MFSIRFSFSCCCLKNSSIPFEKYIHYLQSRSRKEYPEDEALVKSKLPTFIDEKGVSRMYISSDAIDWRDHPDIDVNDRSSKRWVFAESSEIDFTKKNYIRKEISHRNARGAVFLYFIAHEKNSD